MPHPIHASRIRHFISKKRGTLKEIFQEHFREYADRLENLLELGAIYVNKRRVFKDSVFPPSTYFRIHIKPKRFPVCGIIARQRIVYEEADFLVADKPKGIPTHATLDNAIENFKFLLEKELNLKLYTTQRLDQPTQGLVLFAKSKSFQRKFNNWLSCRKVTKHYRALVKKKVEEGFYKHKMLKSNLLPKRAAKEGEDYWQCELRVLKCESLGKFFMVEVFPITGRTHQIRFQLSLLGSPILGDSLYGSDYISPLFLQSSFLFFPGLSHPIELSVPESWSCLFS